jgi:hypothetical protein
LRSLADVQAEFAAALVDPEAGVPASVTGPDGRPAPRRFAVYRNNVIAGLVNALTSSYPAVRRIVGEDFFGVMARRYVLAEPPSSPVLMDYGASFADFIGAFEPASSLPYLPDVARIERAWREAYHAEDAAPLTAEVIAQIPAGKLADTAFALHPSLRVVRSKYPALRIWRMNATDEPVAPVDLSVAEDTMIVRPEADVEVRLMPPGGALFVLALAGGEPLGAAAEAAISGDAAFNLAGNIAGLVSAGVLVAIHC